ncbi:OB-fold domain-containing protein [Rhodococcus sp. ARC_M6]|uniref:OB-fold domain-containing protein n=1 Tax=Rhodococcus sp. ARC_M6 TaxID=2928852 RepID=UPI001FB2ADE0|nr:OB-fold domain-containing protein [Rhodococcus sp. ARC_M6]MCJ0907221.1 OB-fold domain-containing protein [Rhodococcus sp. ARC_M6]
MESKTPASETLPIRAVRCLRCTYVASPVQHFGCEQCGAYGDDLEEFVLSGDGTVLEIVNVYRHPDSSLTVPAVIGSIELIEGPVIRVRLTSPDLQPGSRVFAVDEAPDAALGLVFAPALQKAS